MANNRLWAVCKDDNEATCLGKNYGLWGGLRSPDEFFEKHQDCPSNAGGQENIVWCDEFDDRVIKYDFSKRKIIQDKNDPNIEYEISDIRIYFKGQEDRI